MILTPTEAARRAQAERLFRETEQSARAIAAQTGFHPTTLRNWCRNGAWRRPVVPTPPSDWPAARRAALARIDETYGVARDDIAAILGLSPSEAPAFLTACGLPASPDRAPPGPALLRARLLAHIARQIAGFDAALKDAGPGLDSARVLRDLGGLKRLLDDLDPVPRSDSDAGRDADGTGDADLPALRAQIAQRYAAFMGERPDAGLPREPAAAPDPGPGP